MSLTVPTIIRTVRRKGLLSIIAAARKKISRYYIDETIVFLRFDTQELQVPPCRSLSATSIEPVENPDAANFKELCALFPDKSFPSRLENEQQRCFIAVTDGLVSGYAWMATRACHVDELRWTLPLNDDEGYIYDCFVMPGYRRQGIYTAMLTTVLREVCAIPGYPVRYVCIGSAPENAASLRVIKTVGFREYFRMRYRLFRGTGSWLMTRIEPIPDAVPAG